MNNPFIAEIMRGGIVESRHRGAYCVVDRSGHVIAAEGGIAAAVFPRSAIKAFQCLAMVESGAADRFGFTAEELALACASHDGEPDHVRVARGMLEKAGNDESLYECGAHWPDNEAARHELVRSGKTCQSIHNNCSGKHAAMLAFARHLDVDPRGYTSRDHAVQRAIAATIGMLCDCDPANLACGIDGCSVPTWAIPIRNLARGFARFCEPENKSALRIIKAVRNHPFMVAGTGSFDTELMLAVPRVFVKTGAEGVYCGCIPHAGLGIALKCDDGASRAARVAMASVLAGLDVWTADERETIQHFRHHPLRNWRKIETGEIRAVSL